MKFSDMLFSLRHRFWEEYHRCDGNIDSISEPFKEMLIFFFNDKADEKIEERVRAYNIKNWENINPEEMLEDLLQLRTRVDQLPTDVILECINYYKHNDDISVGMMIMDYENANDFKKECNFTNEMLIIEEISKKYNNFPLELIGEFLDYLQE